MTHERSASPLRPQITEVRYSRDADWFQENECYDSDDDKAMRESQWKAILSPFKARLEQLLEPGESPFPVYCWGCSYFDNSGASSVYSKHWDVLVEMLIKGLPSSGGHINDLARAMHRYFVEHVVPAIPKPREEQVTSSTQNAFSFLNQGLQSSSLGQGFSIKNASTDQILSWARKTALSQPTQLNSKHHHSMHAADNFSVSSSESRADAPGEGHLWTCYGMISHFIYHNSDPWIKTWLRQVQLSELIDTFHDECIYLRHAASKRKNLNKDNAKLYSAMVKTEQSIMNAKPDKMCFVNKKRSLEQGTNTAFITTIHRKVIADSRPSSYHR
jgi:hypothetical protein